MKIQSEELTWYPDKKGYAVLDGITMEFAEGGFYGIIGSNGSGKTSFLRHILRFLKIDHGRLMLGGRDLSEFERKELARELAFVPQNTQIDSDFTVYDIVMMGRNPYMGRFSQIRQQDRERVDEALRLTSCVELRERKFVYLSGGEAQRVLIARAIAQDTPWLLLDEPVSSLDIRHQMEIMQTLADLNREKGKSVIVILHDLNLAARFCSHLVMMKKGKVIAAGRVEELMQVNILQDIYGIEFVEAVHPETGRVYYFPK